MRAHIVVPEKLMAEVDELVGKRQRSRFFVEAVSKEVARLKLLRAMAKAFGAVSEGDAPDWDAAESGADWVEKARRVDAEHLDVLHQPDPKP